MAKAYFKLLSYKDEYEVARLQVESGFLTKIANEFSSDVKIKFHLAPPLLAAARDARGRPKKRSFGAWILPVFKVLSRMKRLRGTTIDPFGYTSHRQLERSLIPWFEGLVDAWLHDLSVESLPPAIEAARLITEIRGYGSVKEAAIARVKGQIAPLYSARGEVGLTNEAPLLDILVTSSASGGFDK